MDRLIDDEGRIRWGLYDDPVGRINYADFILKTPMGRRIGRLKKHFKVHQFTFFGFMGPELMGGVAVVDLRYLSSGFAYLFERRTGRVHEISVRSPAGADISPTPESPRSIFRSRKLRVAITGQSVSVNSPDFGFDLAIGDLRPPPIRMCTRCGYRGWQYTQKTSSLALDGQARIGGRLLPVASPEYRGLSDWTGGYLRHETCWNWAACAATLADGRSLGFNLSCEVNETSFTENALWIDGRLTKLDTAAFVYDEGDLSKPWRITSSDGRVDLVFRPEARHAEMVNALMVASCFSQLMGTFEGTVRPESGEAIAVSACAGFVEDHYAKW